MSVTILKLRQQFKVDNPELYAFLLNDENRKLSHFIQSLWDQLCYKGKLSLPQIQGIKSAMKYAEKRTEMDELREVHKDSAVSGNYVGTLKERYDMTLKYTGTKSTTRGFYIHNFIDKFNNNLMTFAQEGHIDNMYSTNGMKLKPGECFTCRATVNRHSINEYDPTNKVKQTVINRVKYNKFLGSK
jgi:hypothetical protein|tara:strand:+ start:249 stop:806 length:558 start_codon:yes stop_codon:yes gene_type:complete